MIDIVKKDECTGCAGCYNSCPKDAIKMEEDENGFLFPVVDEEKCIKCGICVKKCPALNKVEVKENFEEPIVYAAWSLDENTRFESTSGGIFTEIANNILSKNGYVAGARYGEDNKIEHCIINRKEDMHIIRQSKYAQSDKGLIYRKIKELLLAGEKVLFCGTPCEVGALINFLGKKYENLTLCDFICRGSNSPKVYRKYLDYLENKYNSKIKRVWFKNKTYGWNRFSTKLEFENGKSYIKDRYRDLYMRCYIQENLYMRSCCEKCNYKEFPHVSDITLADFWGVTGSKSSLDYDKGTSLVLINSLKGKEIFEEIKDNIFAEENSLANAIKGNPCITKSVVMNEKRDEFFKDIDNMDFKKAVEKYCDVGLKNKVKRIKFLYRVEKVSLKRKIKKVIEKK